MTNQCHDITVFPEIGLAAGACSGNGILMDISDPVNPVRLDHVVDKNFAYWHSATFNNDGTEDRVHRRMGRRLAAALPGDRSADLGRRRDLRHRRREAALRRLLQAAGGADRTGELRGAQRVAHSRCRGATSWCRRGIRAACRCSISPIRPTPSRSRSSTAVRSTRKQLVSGGYWSTYWYNGHVYGAEIARGIDVFRLMPSEHLSQNEIDAATLVRVNEFNAQQQPKVAWPDAFVVARAYLDQLTRSKTLQSDRITAVKAAIDRADRRQPTRADVDQLDTMAVQLERDAAGATGRDAARLRSLAETLKSRAARLR